MTTLINSNKKIPISRLLNIVLVIILMGLVFFGWWYFTRQSPIDAISRIAPAPVTPVPDYLYTIYGPNNSLLNKPSNTVVFNDKIYVADTKNGRIAVFNYDGQYLTAIGKDQLKLPIDIAFNENEIYVTDTGTRKVHVYNQNGQFIRYFGDKVLEYPVAIYYKDQKLYVLDATTVRILDQAGKELKSFGREGENKGEFYFPYSIHVSGDNKIFVADSNNNRIQVFDQEGKLLEVLSGADINEAGGFAVPRGIAFDRAGNMYTAEGLSNDVAIANKEGKVFARLFEGEKTTDDTGVRDQIKLPTSVFIDNNQRLYVTEFGKSRILVYKIK